MAVKIEGKLRKFGAAPPVLDKNGISPTIVQAMGTGGNNVPMVQEQILETARALDSNMWKGIDAKGFFEKHKRNVVKAFLTPDRKKKRQHGRRQKEDEEPMFTLTGQDIHGINDGKLRRLTPIECERLLRIS